MLGKNLEWQVFLRAVTVVTIVTVVTVVDRQTLGREDRAKALDLLRLDLGLNRPYGSHDSHVVTASRTRRPIARHPIEDHAGGQVAAADGLRHAVEADQPNLQDVAFQGFHLPHS